MNLDNLQPGPETDRLVAEAIGKEYRGADFSTNLIHAFWAAEQVFDDFWELSHRRIINERNKNWHFSGVGRSSPPVRTTFVTPAMAICLAILKLKESTTCQT